MLKKFNLDRSWNEPPNQLMHLQFLARGTHYLTAFNKSEMFGEIKFTSEGDLLRQMIDY